MTKTPKFGFSALLKIICANEKPQKRHLRDRHKPSKGGGYDFHKSLRWRIQQLASENMTAAEAISSTENISMRSERVSALNGLKAFIEWRSKNPNPISFCDAITFESPKGLFKVKFTANFLTEIDNRITAVHVWNTKEKLSKELVTAMLTVVALNWPETTSRPDDFAVLSLRTGEIFRWSDHSSEHESLGVALMVHIEKLCTLVRKDLGLPAIKPNKEPPSPPEPK